MERSQGSSNNSPTWGDLLQSYATQTTQLQVNMNELIFNLRNMEATFTEPGVRFEAWLGQVETLVVALQAKLGEMRRELQALTQPPTFVDFMETEVEARKQDGDRGLDENTGTSVEVKEELTKVVDNRDRLKEILNSSGLN